VDVRQSTSTPKQRMSWTVALTGLFAVALITGCAIRKPTCDGAEAENALQSLFREQTARILQHYAFDQSDPLHMVKLGAALDLGLADDGVTLMLRPEDAAKITWQFEAREVSSSLSGSTTCIGRAGYSRGQFSNHFSFKYELRYASGGEIYIDLLN
jgi:hypothetical protein